VPELKGPIESKEASHGPGAAYGYAGYAPARLYWTNKDACLLACCNDTGIAFCFPNDEEAEVRRTYKSDDP